MSRLSRIAAIPAGSWTRWVVMGFWLVVLVVAYPLSGKLTGAEKNDTSAWLPASAESVKVLDVQTSFQPPNTYAGVVVYDRAPGLTAADRAKAAADARRFAGLPGVVPGQVAGPIRSADGTAMQIIVPVNVGAQGWNGAIPPVDAMRAIAGAGADGLATHVTGPLGYAADNAKVYQGLSSSLLYAALGVVIVILLITYRSPVLWLLPVICSGVALVTADAVVYLLAAHAGLTVNEESAAILDVLVFGASTDYALLIVARYREELRRNDRRGPAMAEALRRAGPAVIASGSTVIIALLMLSFAQLGSTKGLGPVLAIGVGVGLLAMLTLLPALLVSFPRWIFWPYAPRYGSAEPTTRGLWARVGWAIAPRPRLVWVATAVLLGVLALGLTGLKAGGLTNAQSFRSHPDSVTGETVLAAHFPAGAGQPVIVIGSPAAAAPLRAAFAATAGIAHVSTPVTVAGYTYLQGTLTAPPDSQAAYDTIDRVRAAVHAVPGARALVGGQTAVGLDVARASAHDRDLLLPLILAVVLIILALLLRALVAPLILTATVVLSFAAALGVSAFFFNHVFGFGGADTSFPLLVYVFLVALGIDYNIFLMTRIREEAHRRDARHGAITGLAATGGVITSAGFVLAGTFAVLTTIPSTFSTELGFAVAFGILLDTIVVRLLLVTALNLDVGRWMWWPSRLARTPDPAPADLGQERAAALAGERALRIGGFVVAELRETRSTSASCSPWNTPERRIMKIESSVTSISWIPSAAIAGVTRVPFEAGVTHYDNPPPDRWDDLDQVVGPEGARFANDLRAWIEVEDGQITGYGQGGGGRISNTLFRVAGMRIQVEAVGYPELRPEPVVGADFVRFAQTAGGRPGMPSPRLVKGAPFIKTEGPTVWTTLALTLYADGSTGYELAGASSFPRHWIYDADGALAGKSALIDFKTWYRTANLARSPWRSHDNPVLAADAETALERHLSRVIMAGGLGPAPRPTKVKAGTTIMAEGEAADDIVLLLDGLVQVEAGGTELARLGPGSVLGERASIGQGRRTATVRAVTDCRVVSYLAADLPARDLQELAAGHYREDRPRMAP